MTNIERIGVYGGTFDPIHQTHIAIARAALRQAKLDRVLFVVAACAPHKRHASVADAEDRCALVAEALAGEPRMEASRIELDRGGLSFTIDTLSELHARRPEAELYLIVGQDSMADVPGWKDPKGIVSLAHFLVAPRPDAPARIPDVLRPYCDLLSFEESAVSSTEIRERLARGEGLSDVLPSAVENSIREKGLYGAADHD